MESFKKQVDSIRRWKWLVLIFGALACIAAIAIAASAPTEYTSKATVIVGSASQSGGRSPDQDAVVARGYIELLNSPEYRTVLARRAGIPEGVKLSASTVATSPFINVAATGASPRVVREAADRFADAFIKDTLSVYGGIRGVRTGPIRGRIRSISTRIALLELRQDRTRDASDSARAKVQGEIAQLEIERSTLSNRLETQLGIAENPNLAGVFAQAGPAAEKTSSALTNGVLGLIGGLALGCAVALLLGALELRLSSPVDVRERLGLPTLGSIRGGRGPGSERHRDKDFKTLASALATMQPQARSIAVTSPSAGEGKSLVASNLARYRAAQGDKVILIEADTTDAQPHLNGHRALGLADLLSAGRPVNLRDAVTATDQPNLKVIGVGSMPDDPYALFSAERVRDVIESAGQHADLVVIDSPPLLSAAESQVISSGVDGTVLVLDALGTKTAAAVEARDVLNRSRGAILGVVLNRVSGRPAGLS